MIRYKHHTTMQKIRGWLLTGYVEPAIVVLYLCATLQFVRYYSKATTFYLNMGLYLNGQERLPFQERVLPIFLIRPLLHSPWVASHLIHADGNFTADRGPLYLISLFALLIAGIFVQKLYNRVSLDRSLKFLVYPLFLYAIIWSYSIHNEANFSYPYDMLSVAFFAAGLYVIFRRYFWFLAAIIVLGTLNRETTLFLIGIFILDAASLAQAEPLSVHGKRFNLRAVPWFRATLLFCIWLAIKIALARHFVHNDNSENFVRLWSNIGRLKPRLWPALLNICGYMLPIVFMLRRYLRPPRFANYLFIFPVWFAAMFYTGVIVETRVYGELCSFTAIALVLILEQYLRERFNIVSPIEIEERGTQHGTATFDRTEKDLQSVIVRVS